jgi:hypothetical protein
MRFLPANSAPVRRFPRIGWLGFAVSACLLAGTVPTRAAEAQATGSPRLEPEESVLHAGTVIQGEAAEVEFVLHNRGDAPLTILRAKPG